MRPPSPRFLIIGAGSRGHAYARAVTLATSGTIAAVAEPNDFKRRAFGKKYIWRDHGVALPGQEFVSWQDWLGWEAARRSAYGETDQRAITGVFICTLDETHAEIIQALAPLNLHIMCEKPLALSLADCLSISRALCNAHVGAVADGGQDGAAPDEIIQNRPSKIFSIGHVLRYSPHNQLLRTLLLHDKVIGDIVSIEHTEPVGWWHFSHSYVRGNWRRSTAEGVGSLLTKSCHDIDFLLWLLCSPPRADGRSPPHIPSMITS